MKDSIKLKGHVNAVLIDENGNKKQEVDFDNLVVDAGKDWIIDRIQANATATGSKVAIGTGVGAAAGGDTTLGTQTAAVEGTTSQPTSVTARSVATFGAGVGTGTITEYGLFADATLIGRIVSGSVPKAASDSLQVTYDVSVS